MTLNRSKIVIIDTEPRYVHSLLKLFSDHYVICSTLDSTRATELIEAERPKLILLNLTMPHMDGHHVMRQIKQNREIADISIIVETS